MLTVWFCGIERLRIEARAGNDHQFVDHGRGIYGQIVDAHAAQRAIRVQHGLPLQENAPAVKPRSHSATAASRSSRARAAPHCRSGSESHSPPNPGSIFNAAKAGKRARIQNVAGVFVLFRCAQQNYLAGVARADEDSTHPFRALNGSEAQALLRLEMGNVGIAAVVLNAENAPAIAAQRQQAIGPGSQRVDDLILAGPELARRLALRSMRKFPSLRAPRRWCWPPAATLAAPS